MTERDKLIEILKNDSCQSPMLCDPNCKYAKLERCYEERTADYLLENGVTLNRTWIPVDKTLPTTDGCFEVTIKGSKGKRRVGIANFNKNASFNKWSCCGNVIAWRERDKPYGY